MRLPECLAEARKERDGALAKEVFGHFGLLGIREVRVAALLRRKVSGVQPGKSVINLKFSLGVMIHAVYFISDIEMRDLQGSVRGS